MASNQLLEGPDGWKIIDLRWGRINYYPSSRKFNSPLFLPASLSSWSRILDEIFDLTWCHQGLLTSPCALHPKLRRFKDIVRWIVLDLNVPEHRQDQTNHTCFSLSKNLEGLSFPWPPHSPPLLSPLTTECVPLRLDKRHYRLEVNDFFRNNIFPDYYFSPCLVIESSLLRRVHIRDGQLCRLALCLLRRILKGESKPSL